MKEHTWIITGLWFDCNNVTCEYTNEMGACHEHVIDANLLLE